MIQKDFVLSDKEGGFIQTAFIICLTLCSPLCGYFGDRQNRKYILTLGLILWIFSVLGCSFCASTVGFILVYLLYYTLKHGTPRSITQFNLKVVFSNLNFFLCCVVLLELVRLRIQLLHQQ